MDRLEARRSARVPDLPPIKQTEKGSDGCAASKQDTRSYPPLSTLSGGYERTSPLGSIRGRVGQRLQEE